MSDRPDPETPGGARPRPSSPGGARPRPSSPVGGRSAPEPGRPVGARLRLARLARGLSQQELAETAGVTRQSVAGVEGGRWDPSLRVALALSRALGQSVEDLFGPPAAQPSLDAVLLTGSPVGRQDRVDVARVGETVVALSLAGDQGLRAGFAPAGAVLCAPPRPGAQQVEVRPTEAVRPALVVAGCDPALPLLAGPLALLDPPVALRWWPCSSRQAMRLVARGLVHVAGVHLPPDDVGAIAGMAPPELRARGAEVIAFCAWEEGLGTAPGGGVRGMADVASGALRFVNREPGSEARELVEREMHRHGLASGDVTGFDSAVGGHLLVAAAVSAGLGDAGITTEPAALAYGLEFAPLVFERSVLVLPRPQLASLEMRSLLRVLASPALRAQLGAVPGYQDVDRCGESVGSL